jgi:hypothetical protein
MDSDEIPRINAWRTMTSRTAAAAAQSIDLHRFRQLVYVGAEGEVLAALLDSWQQLTGVWVGSPRGQAAACRFLEQSGLADRMRYVAGDALAVPAVDLVVLNAVSTAVEQSLNMLVSANAGWLPPEGRWLIRQREPSSPHHGLISTSGGDGGQGAEERRAEPPDRR